MRGIVLIALILATGCSDPEPHRDPRAPHGVQAPATAGGERARIASGNTAATTMRSGPQVPVTLPPGFTVYPGAKVVANTVFERAGERDMLLLVFETSGPMKTLVAFYRKQANAASATLSLDLGGDERASLGGALAGGGNFSIAIRRQGLGTRVEFAAD